MRIALAVNRVSQDAAENLRAIVSGVKEASVAGASLVMFPEAALTGLINDGDPAHDLPLGVAIPGKETALIGMAAKAHSIYVALGLFEREGDSLFDSAILIDSNGQIAMKYRRISVGWRDLAWSPLVYKEGSTLDPVVTPYGCMAFLICGDLFDDSL